MKRRTPAARAASTMAAVPPTLTASKPARSGALIRPAMWMTASAPSQSAARLSGRSSAPSTQSIPSSGGRQPRVRARTGWPAARAAASRWPPTKPVPPVTASVQRSAAGAHSGDQSPPRRPSPRAAIAPSAARIASRIASTPSPVAPETMKTGRAAFLRQLGRQRRDQLVVDRVGLVERDQLDLVVQARAIGVELVADGAVGGRRRPRCWRRRDGAGPGCARHGRGSGRRCPAPSAAPSIRPGMSARTNSTPLWRTTPSFGWRVVKG